MFAIIKKFNLKIKTDILAILIMFLLDAMIKLIIGQVRFISYGSIMFDAFVYGITISIGIVIANIIMGKKKFLLWFILLSIFNVIILIVFILLKKVY